MKIQRGVALITALLVVALATIAATAMLVSSNLAVHRSATLSDTERAWWYVDGAEAWVRAILFADYQKSLAIDDLGEPWAHQLDYLPVDEGGMRGSIIDLQGRFNLNNLGLADLQKFPNYKAQFELLLQNIDGLQTQNTTGLAEAIRDWIDTDTQPQVFSGAEDDAYDGLPLPYRAANQPMTSISELLAVKGVTKEIYLALRNYICALPRLTPINVNTAPLPVLLSLSAQPSPTLAQFVETRDKKPADNEQTFTSQYFPGQGALPVPIAVKSQYFEMRAEAVIGSSHVALYSVMDRLAQPNGVPAVISRSQDFE